MGKLLDQASEEMQAEKYDGFKPKPVAGYPKERLQWLWPDMIARGIFHVFAGDSGIGKTLLLCDIPQSSVEEVSFRDKERAVLREK